MRSVAIALLGVTLVHGAAAGQTPTEQAAVLQGFHVSVEAYAERRVSIFTLPVAMVFRQIIRRTLHQEGTEALLAELVELPLDRRPQPYEPFPATALQEFPAILANALPALPVQLEYRLIGYDLVLRDRDADLIVAVLRDAAGRSQTVRH